MSGHLHFTTISHVVKSGLTKQALLYLIIMKPGAIKRGDKYD